MKELDDLFNDIKIQLNIEKSKYKKSKICNYSFEVSKVGVLSLATGLSFLNIFAILSMILIPIIDTVKNTANVDQRIVMQPFLIKKMGCSVIVGHYDILPCAASLKSLQGLGVRLYFLALNDIVNFC